MLRGSRISIEVAERWVLNLCFRRSRLFRVRVADCIDEFGHSYGLNGTHFFVQALRSGETFNHIQAFLREFYKSFIIKSFNEVVGHDIGNNLGKQYFLPWDERVRSLSSFERSSKAGPTNGESLRAITERLYKNLVLIKGQGFKQFSIPDGFPRVCALIDRNGRKKFVIRHGQHRTAVLSYLGEATMWVCYEAVHYERSRLYQIWSRLFRGGVPPKSRNFLTTVYEADVNQWPHVRNGNVNREDALKAFHAVLSKSP